jgi:hypothetical protein
VDPFCFYKRINTKYDALKDLFEKVRVIAFVLCSFRSFMHAGWLFFIWKSLKIPLLTSNGAGCITGYMHDFVPMGVFFIDEGNLLRRLVLNCT